MQEQLNTTCFESVCIRNALQADRELCHEQLVHWNIWNSFTPRQEQQAKSLMSQNWLNQHSLLHYSTVLELLQTIENSCTTVKTVYE